MNNTSMPGQSAMIVIPARFGSTRFPGKPLAEQTGKPLIQHVVEQARQARRAGRIIVATDDSRIAEAVDRFGSEVMLTRADHPNGTSRIAEVVQRLGPQAAELIVNVQGDEPEIDPRVIDELIAGLAADADALMATLASPFTEDEDPADPNHVKLVVDQRGRAMYFSRALIPFNRDGQDLSPPLKHVGCYIYRREFLAEYLTLTPTPLEQAEQLEQLRVLEHGHRIAVIQTRVSHHGIDTPEQYAQFVARHGSVGG